MKKYKSIYFLVFWLAVFASGPKQSWSQGLPQPSGKFSIGHHRFEWTDTTRTEILAADRHCFSITRKHHISENGNYFQKT
jgi:hypothetical protein